MSVYKYKFHRRTYYYFRVNINGKQFSRRMERNNRFHTYEDALRSEYLFLKKHSKNKLTKSTSIHFLTDDFISYLSKSYKSSTLYSFKRIWLRFFHPFLSNYKVSELNENVFIELNELIDTVSSVDKHAYVSLGKNFLRYIHKYRIIIPESVFTSKRNKEMIRVKKIKFWTYEQFQKFINVVDDVYFRLLFSMLYYYGLRISELRGLRNDCLSKDKLIINSTITNKTIEGGQIVNTTKTRSSDRVFPMLDHIYSLYLDFKKEYVFNSPYVFYSISKNSLVVGETSIRRALIKYCEKSGVEFIHPHSFRHSCASLLINSGMDYMQVASWLGHSSPAVTLSTYSHLFDSRKNEIFNFLNKFGK